MQRVKRAKNVPACESELQRFGFMGFVQLFYLTKNQSLLDLEKNHKETIVLKICFFPGEKGQYRQKNPN